MTARNTKGMTVCMGTAAPVVLNPTAVAKNSADNRAVLTLASTTNIVVGNMIFIPAGGTGFPELDNKMWTVGAVDATTVTLNGSDISSSSGILSGTPSIKHYRASSLTCLCLSELKFNSEKGTTISVGTLCDPSASIPSASTTAGTVDIGGYVDITSSDYQEIVKAEADGSEHWFRIKLPSNGEIVFPAIIATLNWDLPIDGAMGWSAQLALGSRPRHLF